jgi:type II secretory pathway pseudopilin PulG
MNSRDQGYAMAALLVAMSVMAVMMTVAMPVWQQLSQREKEEELVFRGLQYARAIGLYERKYANAPPPSIDVLVQQHFLRRKYKDPITNDDFVPITTVQAAAASATAQPGTTGRAGGAAQPLAPATGSLASTGAQGGVTGVASKSKATSIRIYNGRTHYNEWAFVYAPPTPTPGAGGGPGAATPGQRGQPQRGQQGQPPTGPLGPGGPTRGGTGQRGPGGQNPAGARGGGFSNPFQVPPIGR